MTNLFPIHFMLMKALGLINIPFSDDLFQKQIAHSTVQKRMCRNYLRECNNSALLPLPGSHFVCNTPNHFLIQNYFRHFCRISLRLFCLDRPLYPSRFNFMYSMMLSTSSSSPEACDGVNPHKGYISTTLKIILLS